MADTKEALPVLPDCFEFAMGFLGDPEESEMRAYVATATAAIAELRAEVGRLKADAERLDWSQENLCQVYQDMGERFMVTHLMQNGRTAGAGGENLRAAIDAARAGASGGAE